MSAPVLDYCPPVDRNAAPRRRWPWILLSLPSLVVPFVSFSCDTSPAEVTNKAIQTPNLLHSLDREDTVLLLLAVGLFAAVPVAIWRARLLFRTPPHRGERIVALAAAAMMTIGLLVSLALLPSPSLKSQAWYGFGAAVLVLACGSYATLHLRRFGRSGEFHLVALIVPYVSNATLALILLVNDRNVGWYLAGGSTIAAAVEVALTTYQSRRMPPNKNPALT